MTNEPGTGRDGDRCVHGRYRIDVCLGCDRQYVDGALTGPFVTVPPAVADNAGEECTCGEYAGTSVSYADCPVHTPRPAVSPGGQADGAIDVAHLTRQREWSRKTFGPGDRAKGVVDHIRKELAEIEADPADLGEWVDVVILALDGAWRAGHEPGAIIAAIKAKQARNEARTWPDWRTAEPDRAIEHDRSLDRTTAPAVGPVEELRADLEWWAVRFHETYERLAPSFSYETRRESAVSWYEVPENNRALMIAVCAEVLAPLLTDHQAVSDAAAEAIREVHQSDKTEPYACDWCGEA